MLEQGARAGALQWAARVLRQAELAALRLELLRSLPTPSPFCVNERDTQAWPAI